jgi:hypothetical protein
MSKTHPAVTSRKKRNNGKRKSPVTVMVSMFCRHALTNFLRGNCTHKIRGSWQPGSHSLFCSVIQINKLNICVVFTYLAGSRTSKATKQNFFFRGIDLRSLQFLNFSRVFNFTAMLQQQRLFLHCPDSAKKQWLHSFFSWSFFSRLDPSSPPNF